jgi:RNA polymerase sigma-70 factor, ECF subfamily
VLYDRYSRLVYSVALRVVQNPATAEDILHDIFLQLWRDPGRFDSGRGNLGAWLAVIARNRSIDWLRKQRPQTDTEDVVLVSPVDVSGDAERSALVGKVRTLMREMPENQRSALEMAFFEGLTHTDIAQRTGEPLGTIKTRIRSAVISIRKALER